ncbi:hypothetical protein [Calothrix sp. NIES-2100]
MLRIGDRFSIPTSHQLRSPSSIIFIHASDVGINGAIADTFESSFHNRS